MRSRATAFRGPHPIRRSVRLGLLAGLVGLALGCAAGVATAVTYPLKIQVRTAAGEPLDARVGILSQADGRYHPVAADTSLLAHEGFCYPPYGATVQLPAGTATVTVSRGPEWIPKVTTVNMNRSRTLTVTLQRLVDLRPRGLFAGDLHAHSLESPVEFTVTMAQALRVARAEDLAVLHPLDDRAGFTGVPEPVSDDSTVVYRSFEHRNQTYGHVVLPGLRETIAAGCCLSPEEPWPTLGALRDQVAGPGRALFVLGHPHTTDDYDLQTAWPGAGLGRELPVLAALGELDGMDVVGYTNDPDTCWGEWTDALSSGCRVTPTAGTDAVLCWYRHPPPGGWRVYADLGAGVPFGYDAWVEAVRAGRTFVTSLPLVPSFRVGEAAPGDALEWPGDAFEAPVSLQAACASGLTGVSLVSDRGTLWSVDLAARAPVPLAWDTTFTLATPTPGWLALRVTGVPGGRALLGLPAIAHTNAIRLLRDGQPRRDRAAVGRMLDGIDRLQALLEERPWTTDWHRDSVFARLDRARAVLEVAYTEPPGAFHLVTDVVHGPVPRLEWTAAEDAEPGDRVRYRVTYADDSLFTVPHSRWTVDPWIDPVDAPQGTTTWWRIEALDRAGNRRTCEPEEFPAAIAVALAVPPQPAPRPLVRAWPNPSRAGVRLEGFAPDAVILDVTGRRVAGPGLPGEGRWLVWDGRARGGRVPAGVYRAVSPSTGARISFVLVE